jgi:hypothetical protein
LDLPSSRYSNAERIQRHICGNFDEKSDLD